LVQGQVEVFGDYFIFQIFSFSSLFLRFCFFLPLLYNMVCGCVTKNRSAQTLLNFCPLRRQALTSTDIDSQDFKQRFENT